MVSRAPKFDARFLRSITVYHPEDGVLTWRNSTPENPRGVVNGDPIGALTDAGYWRGTICGERRMMHDFIWLYVTDEWPTADIDHRDGIKWNNRWRNLRHGTRSQNNANAGLSAKNTTGMRGVSFCRATGLWRASISIEGRSVNLGRHPTKEDAARAYDVKAFSLHGEFARLNFPDGV